LAEAGKILLFTSLCYSSNDCIFTLLLILFRYIIYKFQDPSYQNITNFPYLMAEYLYKLPYQY